MEDFENLSLRPARRAVFDISNLQKRGVQTLNGQEKVVYKNSAGGTVVIDKDVLHPPSRSKAHYGNFHYQSNENILDSVGSARRQNNRPGPVRPRKSRQAVRQEHPYFPFQFNGEQDEFELIEPEEDLSNSYQEDEEEDTDLSYEDGEVGAFNVFGSADDQKKQQEVHVDAFLKASMLTRKKRLTTGERQLKRFMADKTTTEADFIDQMDRDEIGLRMWPCMSPETAMMHKILGPRDVGEDCYACQRGLGIERVQHETLKNLKAMITDLLKSGTHISECCLLISDYWEQRIQIPCNKQTQSTKGIPLIGKWSPQSVRIHIFYHERNPSYRQRLQLDRWCELDEFIWEHEVFRAPARSLQNGSVPRALMRVSLRGLKMLELSSKRIENILKWNTKAMVGQSAESSIQPIEGEIYLKEAAVTAVNYNKTVSAFQERNTDRWN